MSKHHAVLLIFIVGVYAACIYATLANPAQPAANPQDEAQRARQILEHEDQIARDLNAQWKRFEEQRKRKKLTSDPSGRRLEPAGE